MGTLASSSSAPSRAATRYGERLPAQVAADAAVVLQREGGRRLGERDAAEHLVAVPELGRLGAQEFAPRRRIEIEIGHRDGGARRARGGLHFADLGAFGLDRPGVTRSGVAHFGACRLEAGRDRQPRHRGDRGQRLAAKAHRGDAFQVLQAADLARGVAREGERQILAGHALAVVLDLQALHAAFVERDRDSARAGIEGCSRAAPSAPRRAAPRPRRRRSGSRGARQDANGGHERSI